MAAAAGYAYAQAPAAQPVNAPSVPEITIEKIVTAVSVENREPVDETSTFDKTAGRVYTWTKVAATATPVKLKHVYYAANKKVAEIDLSINAKAYRVWSSKAVWPGDWKVEATDEAGKVLATVTFTVSNTAAASKTETPTQGK